MPKFSDNLSRADDTYIALNELNVIWYLKQKNQLIGNAKVIKICAKAILIASKRLNFSFACWKF